MRRDLNYFNGIEFSQIQLCIKGALRILDIVHEARAKFAKDFRGDYPKGVVLPARAYMVLIEHYMDLKEKGVLTLDQEHKIDMLMGMSCYASNADRPSFILTEQQAFRIAYVECL